MKICDIHFCEKVAATYVVGGRARTQYSCKECQKEYKDKWYKNNREKILDQKSNYYQENKEVLDKKHSEYVRDNKEDIKNYKSDWFQNNKESIYKNRKERYDGDVSFRLRDIFSTSIRQKLKTVGSSKNDNSFLQFLDYSILELKEYLESHFEPWMTWDNYGKYNSKTWDDNDRSTWTWNIDHIIPQSLLPYTSMEDDNFKKCWALENLRPFAAKQNLLDGLSRTRHR